MVTMMIMVLILDVVVDGVGADYYNDISDDEMMLMLMMKTTLHCDRKGRTKLQ